MSNFTPGTRYRFSPKPGKSTQKPVVVAYNTRTLTYLRDESGDLRFCGQRVVHHIFQWRGGALECFTDAQTEDYQIREI